MWPKQSQQAIYRVWYLRVFHPLHRVWRCKRSSCLMLELYQDIVGRHHEKSQVAVNVCCLHDLRSLLTVMNPDCILQLDRQCCGCSRPHRITQSRNTRPTRLDSAAHPRASQPTESSLRRNAYKIGRYISRCGSHGISVFRLKPCKPAGKRQITAWRKRNSYSFARSGYLSPHDERAPRS